MPTESSSSVKRWFPKHIAEDMYLEEMKASERMEVYDLIGECVSAGRNVGVDEYPTQVTLSRELQHSSCILVKRRNFMSAVTLSPDEDYEGQGEPEIAAAILIKDLYASRVVPSLIANVKIFTDHDLHKKYNGVYGQLISLSEKIARLISAYYVANVVYVFRKCESEIRVLRKKGYLPLCCLPLGGNLIGQETCCTILLYKHFTDRRIITCTKEMKHIHNTRYLRQLLQQSNRLSVFKHMSALPHQYNFRCELRTIISEIGYSEMKLVYEMFKENILEGNGFTADDASSFRLFKLDFLEPSYNMIVTCVDSTDDSTDDLSDDSIIAYISFRENHECRGSKGRTTDTTILVNPMYRGRGIGVETQIIADRIALQYYGFTGSLSDSPIFNHKVHDIASAHNYVTIGYLPECVDMPQSHRGRMGGVVDLAVNYYSFSGLREQYGLLSPTAVWSSPRPRDPRL